MLFFSSFCIYWTYPDIFEGFLSSFISNSPSFWLLKNIFTEDGKNRNKKESPHRKNKEASIGRFNKKNEKAKRRCIKTSKKVTVFKD